MKRILVTGAQGQLARQLQLMGIPESSGDEWTFLSHQELDITDETQLFQAFRRGQFTHVLNCAAYTAVDAAEDNPEKAYHVNAHGAALVARVAKEYGASVIHISTDYVFGGEGNSPYREEAIVSPRGVYAASKREGEVAMLSSEVAMVIRTSWLYSSHSHSFFRTIRQKCVEGMPLQVVYDQVGSPTWAGSLANAIITILQRKTFMAGIFHFADSGMASWYDVAVAIRELVDCANPITPIRSEMYPTKAKRPNFSVLDTQWTCETLALQTSYWRTALARCYAETIESKNQNTLQ